MACILPLGALGNLYGVIGRLHHLPLLAVHTFAVSLGDGHAREEMLANRDIGEILRVCWQYVEC